MPRDLQVFSGRSDGPLDTAVSDLVEDLVVVSNREPYRHCFASDGAEEATPAGDDPSVRVERPTGGLTAGLDPVVQRLGGTWIAWGDGEADFEVTDDRDRVGVPPDDPAYTLQRVRLEEAEVRGYYDGYANQTLWPLCHSRLETVRVDDQDWECYAAVNERFADLVCEHADADTTVWFQDYHFALAPLEVQARMPEAFLMQFWHIPWPAPDVFRSCPQQRELLSGLLGNDLLGFHVPRYCANFLRCVEAEFDDAAVDWAEGRVHREGHTTTVRAFPLGVDAGEIEELAAEADPDFWREFKADHGIGEDVRVALAVDRLDYTKGIPERLAALEHLWETRPELRGAFTFVQKGSESRERIPAYQELQAEVEAAIGRINERFGTEDWQPVVFTTKRYDRGELCAIYRFSDVALVGPLRDGMNLVAQEYVAAQIEDDGVLVLSEFAGVHEAFEDYVLTVNPLDTEGYADAIERAFAMDERERSERMRELRRAAHEYDINRWLSDVFETAADVERARGSTDSRIGAQ